MSSWHPQKALGPMRASSIVRAATLLAFLLLAGCLQATPWSPSATHRPLVNWRADCSIEADPSPGGGVCVRLLAANSDPQLEASLATDPQDARTVAVTWTVRHGGASHIYAAVTHDAGRTWRTTLLEDPTAGLPGIDDYAFDSIAAFGPDGTLFVMYGGNDPRPDEQLGPTSRITVAATTDVGADWSYHRLTEGPIAVLWDFMDLAVAPDTGELYVVAGSTGYRGVWLWASHDEAATWGGPTPVVPPTAPQEADATLPRISAGPSGLVMILRDSVPDAESLVVSHDGGATFGAPILIDFPSTYPSAPAIASDGSVARLVLAAPSANDLVERDSRDGGQTWAGPSTVWAGGHDLKWTAPAIDPHGGLGLLAEDYASCGQAPWAAFALLSDALTDSLQNVTLASSSADRPVACGPTDDYGGAAFASDGSFWAAWSDPRGAASDRIAVAHLVEASS
jgi:hypothetical protein